MQISENIPTLTALASRGIPYSESVKSLCLWTREKCCHICNKNLCDGKCENINKCIARYIIQDKLPTCTKCDT